MRSCVKNNLRTEIEILKEKNRGHRIALKLQATINETRLQSLNGEWKRLEKVLATTIPRELHEQVVKEQLKINEQNKIEMVKMQAEIKSKISPRGLWTAVVSGATVAGVVFTILNNIL